jgi:DNA-binding NarL/FixJ family response regulator
MKAGRPQNTPEVLWKKVDVKNPDECWPWIGFVTECGYGRTWIEGKAYYAHRVIFNLANPDMIELRSPTNKKARGFLMHLCDNRVCCNPAHLRVANLRENNLDMHEKGRVKHKTGEDHHRSVFTNTQIDEIMSMRNNGITMSLIAEKMNANKSTVKSLIRRKTNA